MLTDLRYALRLLAKSPWFTGLTVLVLAGGLGISLYTYAALNMMIYRDLPLPDSGSIVKIGYGGWPNFEPLDAFELAELRARAQGIGELGVYRDSRALVGEAGASRSIMSAESDWRIFEFTRTQPLLGRGFVRADASAGAEPVAVLGYATWQSAFAGDANVVGTLARINGQLTRIVGVMPEGFGFPVNKGIWLPIPAADLEPTGYSGQMFDAYARMSPGVSVEAAEAELTALVQRARLQQPDSDARADPVSIVTFQEESWGVFGAIIFAVLNLLALSILLLAAVNIGNLLLARTNARMNEIGVRVALGAPRFRLIVQTALENVVLCALGGAFAIFLAARALSATSGFMKGLLQELMPFWWTWSLDGELIVVAAVLLALTLLAVSVLPALSVNRADPNALLKDGMRAGRGLQTGRISRVLVTVQVALISAVMLVGSVAALIASRTINLDPGMDTANVYMMGVTLPENRYATVEARVSFYERLLTELRATPGVDAARIMQEWGGTRFAVAGAEYAAAEDRPAAWLVGLSESPVPIGPTLLEGRTIDGSDGAASLKTALVSRELAREQWPNKSPLGETIEVTIGDSTEQRVIVGVVGDTVFDPAGMTEAGNSAIYIPVTQTTSLPASRALVRRFGDEAAAHGAMYEALARIDPTIAPNIQTYDDAIGRLTLFSMAVTKLFAGCGAFAILLAITGIYGMNSNAVVLRRHEIGLRRALGATNRSVIGLFVKQSARQLTIGLSLSALLSVAVLFFVQQAFSIGAGEIALIGAGVVAVISATVLLSVYLSVRSAVRLDPSSALRQG